MLGSRRCAVARERWRVDAIFCEWKYSQEMSQRRFSSSVPQSRELLI